MNRSTSFLAGAYPGQQQHHPRGESLLPSGGVMGSRNFEFYGKVKANFGQSRSNLVQAYPLAKETWLRNLCLIALRVGELWALRCPLGPVLAKCADCGQTVWRISFSFGIYLPEQQQPRPQRGTPHPQRGRYGAPKFLVLWEGIGQL